MWLLRCGFFWDSSSSQRDAKCTPRVSRNDRYPPHLCVWPDQVGKNRHKVFIYSMLSLVGTFALTLAPSHTISGLTEPLSSQYNPTRSLRILEFPFRLHYDATKSLYHKTGATKQAIKPATVDLNIELWDCSHENQRYI